ncbi:MAG TPA: hypothetical protein DCX02_04275 [Firmicutes bacterium]|nr:hypothetical protein [Bacillota bacterium]
MTNPTIRSSPVLTLAATALPAKVKSSPTITVETKCAIAPAKVIIAALCIDMPLAFADKTYGSQ